MCFSIKHGNVYLFVKATFWQLFIIKKQKTETKNTQHPPPCPPENPKQLPCTPFKRASSTWLCTVVVEQLLPGKKQEIGLRW